MKVSYRWLSEYIDIHDYTAAELADLLTHAGVEVDAVDHRNKGVSQVVVGLVTECVQHPDADKLRVCQVDVGQEEQLQIVCGAANVGAGQKVPVAVVGAVLPDNFKIKRAKLRGVESQGMICSAKELGLNERMLPKSQQDGILVLPDHLELGADIVEVLGLDDVILELDLTPNRSDCLSMLGVAYELSAILDRPIQLPKAEWPATSLQAADHIQVKISATEGCTHYAARYIQDIQIGPSPLWMQNRLIAAGVRPINNVVDITNYCMLEYGQPLHAFDATKLNEGRIDVRMAQQGEKFVTLDDVERELESHMLVITDESKPVALAGVMGGANSEVENATTSIVLESARFDGGLVRRTSKQLGLRSEASLRFEKKVDAEAVIPALNRAAALMVEYAGATVAEGVVEARHGIVQPVELHISKDRINHYLGTDISFAEIVSILRRLQFDVVETEGESCRVMVPSRRQDITRDVDLIEEVARLYGYDRIPTTVIEGPSTTGTLDPEQVLRRTIRQYLSETGMHEAINYSLTHPRITDEFPGLYGRTELIGLAMPMSEERSTLRTSLIPHLLDTAVYNQNRKVEDIVLFELGRAFITSSVPLTDLPEEKQLLSGLWTGANQLPHWHAKASKVTFYDLKGIVEGLLSYLGLHELRFQAVAPQGFHPGRTAEIFARDADNWVSLGIIGQIHPDLLRKRDLDETYVFELQLEPIYKLADFSISYKPAPRYPAMVRDIAVVLPQAAEVGGIKQTVQQVAGALLESVHIFDVYIGERVEEGKKSVALSLVYRHAERTLTDEEVTQLHQKVVDALEAEHGAELRK